MIARTHRVPVEVRRGPILHQRGRGVPSLAPVEALQVTPADAAGPNEVALLRAPGDERHHVLRLPGVAERAAEARRRPGTPAQMAEQLHLAILHQVAAGRRAAAPRAASSIPDTLGQRTHAGEPPV